MVHHFRPRHQICVAAKNYLRNEQLRSQLDPRKLVQALAGPSVAVHLLERHGGGGVCLVEAHKNPDLSSVGVHVVGGWVGACVAVRLDLGYVQVQPPANASIQQVLATWRSKPCPLLRRWPACTLTQHMHNTDLEQGVEEDRDSNPTPNHKHTTLTLNRESKKTGTTATKRWISSSSASSP